MTTTQTQIRRDTASDLSGATPAEGELGYDKTNKRLVIGDGSTAGGIKHASAADIQKQKFVFPTVGGTGDAITLTNTPPVTAYGAGLKQVFKAGAGNVTTSVTAAVDGLATRALKKIVGGAIVDLAIGDIVAGGIYEIDDDGTYFQVKGGLGGGGSVPAALTGTLMSTSSVSLSVDFATYSAYDVYFNDASGAGGGSTSILIDASSNGGISYAAAIRKSRDLSSNVDLSTAEIAVPSSVVTHFVGTITQPSISGGASLVFTNLMGTMFVGGTSYATSAAIDTIRFSTPGSLGSSGSIILQPKSKR